MTLSKPPPPVTYRSHGRPCQRARTIAARRVSSAGTRIALASARSMASWRSCTPAIVVT